MSYLSSTMSASLLALILPFAAVAQSISPEDAANNIGNYVTVEGTVSQVSISDRGTIFLNFGGTYPSQVFYAVIFENNADQFPSVNDLEGRAVAITGTVQLYKGRPEIVVDSPSQIATE